MLSGLFFKHSSQKNQIERLRKKGILLGTRDRNQRKIYLYMLSNLFVEVVYREDNPDGEPERVQILSGLKSLNDYLAKEFQASFNTI